MRYAIAGARGTIHDSESAIKAVHAWATSHGGEVLVADARAVFGRDHLETAVRHALRAQATATMISRSVSMESLRYLSAQRQVSDAIRVAGIHRGSRELAIVVFGTASIEGLLAELGWARDDAVLEAQGKSLRTLGISQKAAATVTRKSQADLALEKVALLDVSK